jgi:Mg-chelatase subunit ChlD
MPEFAQPAWLLLLVATVPMVVSGVRAWRAQHIRRSLADSLRALAVAALVIALAGPLGGSPLRHTELIFALDVSSSVTRASISEGLDLINRARQLTTRVGLVVFGGDAVVESAVREDAAPFGEITGQVDRSGTDIGRAIEVSVGAFGAHAQRRIVLLSDGQENLGDARAAAAVARSLGAQVYAIGLTRSSLEAEVYLQSLNAPPRLRVQEPFKLQAVIHSNTATHAQLIVKRDGASIHEQTLDLQPGANVHSFIEHAVSPGLHEYEAIINAEVDGELENNRLQTLVQVDAAPRVLHVLGDAHSGRYVSTALRVQGLDVREIDARAMPINMRELIAYDLVILNNVSGFDLPLAKLELLERYVRDVGGGVVKIGGDKSYAAGGYHGTPLERLLPVTMHAKTEVRLPSLSVVFVLDRSGSMGSRIGDEETLAIAKRAALASMDLLNRFDRVGVLAFDSTHEWVVPPTEASLRRPIAEQLHKLQAGGGTDLHPALREAHRVMRSEQAKIKHLIVLSDGLTDGEKNFDQLAQRIAADGITVSTVSMGSSSDRALMERLAQFGKGRFYHTEDPRDVPRIFTSETMTIAQELVVEGEIRPRLVEASEILAGLGSVPILRGYQRTYPKSTAQVLLRGRDEDPVLASWRYGLGKAVAFTSDLSGRWGRHWVEWPAFARYVAQLARWSMRHGGSETIEPQFRWHANRGEMIVDVLDRDEQFVNLITLDATVIDPLGTTHRTRLEQIAPGRYRGEFAVPRAGLYYVTLSGGNAAVQIGPQSFGAAVPYSAEYLQLGLDKNLLRDVAAATGAAVLPLSQASLSALMAPSPNPRTAAALIWWPFVLAALLLLVIEVAVRKVPLPEAWRVRWARRRGVSLDVEAPEPSYDALAAEIARERARRLATLDDGVHRSADDATVRARLYRAAGRARAR